MDFDKSKTKKNLEEAFCGESKAHIKYKFFASNMEEEYYPISKILESASNNEYEHAEVWYKLLNNNGEFKELPSPIDNLLEAIAGEHYEHAHMYDEFAKIAKEEGFNDIAERFERVAAVEYMHEHEFKKALDSIKNGSIYKADSDKQIWICQKCGNIHIGKTPPNECEICGHDKTYFKRR